jgi:hypothetical protein
LARLDEPKGRLKRSVSPIRCLILAGSSFFLFAAPAGAQQPGRGFGWQLDAGWSSYHVTRQNGNGFGPTARVHRRVIGALGLELDLTTLLSSDGFYDLKGAAADLGVTVSWNPQRFTATLALGGGGILGSDSDGSVIGMGGAWLSGEMTVWLREHIGFFGRTGIRAWTSGDTSASLAAGIAFRF